MSDNEKLSALTRKLMTGVAAGTLVLTQVGCAPSVTVASAEGADRDELGLCNRAIHSRRAVDVEAFVTTYPASNCVAPLLNAVPQSTLAALPQGILSAVPPTTLARVQPARLAILQGEQRATLGVFAEREDSDSDY